MSVSKSIQLAVLVLAMLAGVGCHSVSQAGGRSGPTPRFYVGGDDWEVRLDRVLLWLRDNGGVAPVLVDSHLLPDDGGEGYPGRLIDALDESGGRILLRWWFFEGDPSLELTATQICLGKDYARISRSLKGHEVALIAREVWLSGREVSWGLRRGESYEIYIAKEDEGFIDGLIREARR